MPESPMPETTESARRHMLLELGFAVRADGAMLRGEAELTPFMHVPGTKHLRTSILATWADQLAGLLAMRALSDTTGRPRVPVTLDLDMHLYRPAPGTGTIRAAGRTVKTGRSVYVGEVLFTDTSGEAFGFATLSFMAAPDVTLTAPDVTSIDAPPRSARLAMPLTARAGMKRESPGLAVLPRSQDGLNSSNTVNGGLLALCAEEAVLSLALGDTLSSLSLRYLGPVRTGPAVAIADLRSGLAQVEIRDSGREDRLAVTATARTFTRI
jgi:acyl-coenzyme A thioesterase PaaI-like protein